jgi:hypothetical protein
VTDKNKYQIKEHTMSVYLCVRNTGAQLPSFVERGLGAYMPGDVDDVNVIAVQTGPANAHYNLGFKNIVAHCKAQLLNVVVTASGMFYNIFRNIVNPISFEVPVGTFSFEGLTDDQKANLRSLGLMDDPKAKNTFVGSPSAADMNFIYSLGPIDSKFVPGNVASEGYLAYIYGLKALAIFSNFSHKLVRPGGVYRFTDKSEDVETARKVDVVRDSIGQEKVVAEVGKVGIFGRIGFTNLVEYIYPESSSKTITPAFIRPSVVTSWASEENYLFGYFNGMTTPSRDLAANVFARLFLKGLSDDISKASKMWQKLRHGFRRLAPTNAGKAMAHAFKGIELALEGEFAITYLVENGVYHGFILSGPGSIVYYNQPLKALTEEELIKEIGKMDNKKRLLGEILAILKSPLNSSGMPVYSFGMDDVNTSRRFLKAYRSISPEYLGSEDFTDKLPALVDEMHWGDRFQVPTEAMIIDFLRYVQTGEQGHIDGYPAYLAGGFYRKEGRVATGLGIFGAYAPSLNYGKTSDMNFQIPTEDSAQDQNLEVINKERHLRFLPFTKIAIGTAEIQWNSLFNTGRIMIPDGRKNKTEWTDANRVLLRIGGNPGFATAYALIKDHAITVRRSMKAGKRKGARDDAESGPSTSRKKARKENQDVAMDI